MKWFLLSLSLLFVVGCQSTTSSSDEGGYSWEHSRGCDH